MEPADQALAWACEQTVVRFTAHLDACDYEAAAALLAPDGVLRRPGSTDIEGRAAMLRWYTNRDPKALVRHILTNLRTERIDDGSAVVLSYVTVYFQALSKEGPQEVPPPSPLMVGRYADTLVRRDTQWQLFLRDVQIDFAP